MIADREVVIKFYTYVVFALFFSIGTYAQNSPLKFSYTGKVVVIFMPDSSELSAEDTEKIFFEEKVISDLFSCAAKVDSLLDPYPNFTSDITRKKKIILKWGKNVFQFIRPNGFPGAILSDGYQKPEIFLGAVRVEDLFPAIKKYFRLK